MNSSQAKKTITSLLLLSMIAMWPVRAAAWGTEGHRMVAAIATRYLNQTAQNRVLELIRYEFKVNRDYYLHQQKENPKSLQAQCVELFPLSEKQTPTAQEREHLLAMGLACMAPWPDPPVKSQRLYTSNWHFVDIPVVLQKAEGALASQFNYDAQRSTRYLYDPARDCATEAAYGDCALQAIERLRPIVGNAKTSGNPFAEDLTARVEALKFLIHIVGDIHQPLHCVTDKRDKEAINNPHDKGDLGGNLKIATWFGETKTPYGLMNLHSIWDDGFISHTMRTMNLTEIQYFNNLLAGIPPSGSAQLSVMQAGDIFKWADESYKLAVEDAYGKLPPIDMTYEYQDKKGDKHKGGFRLGEEYYQANKNIVDQQLRLGGVRLARILNELLNK
jgi:hypothetical protein